MKSMLLISVRTAACPFVPQTLSGVRRENTGPRAGAAVSEDVEHFAAIDRFGVLAEVDPKFRELVAHQR